VHTRVDIELNGSHTRGMTVCALRPSRLSGGDDRQQFNAQVAVNAESRSLIERVIDTLLTYE